MFIKFHFSNSSTHLVFSLSPQQKNTLFLICSPNRQNISVFVSFFFIFSAFYVWVREPTCAIFYYRLWIFVPIPKKEMKRNTQPREMKWMNFSGTMCDVLCCCVLYMNNFVLCSFKCAIMGHFFAISPWFLDL